MDDHAKSMMIILELLPLQSASGGGVRDLQEEKCQDLSCEYVVKDTVYQPQTALLILVLLLTHFHGEIQSQDIH